MSDLQPGAPHNEPHNEPRDPRALDDELMLAQVKAVLTPMPPVDRRHIAQILAATQERKRTPLQRLFGRLEEVLEWWRFNTPPVARGATLAAAALTIGFVGRGYVMNPGAASSNAASVRLASQESAASPATAPAVVRAVEGPVEPSEQRVPTQFVLDARDLPAAHSVALVGDFNDWNVTATPLTLENGAWVATMPLLPGRHVYAFVVNGEKWIADPRAPQATDSDFGRPGSVIIIQAP
jgi:Glycogen recognition site of AMP-activated protein kinase